MSFRHLDAENTDTGQEKHLRIKEVKAVQIVNKLLVINTKILNCTASK